MILKKSRFTCLALAQLCFLASCQEQAGAVQARVVGDAGLGRAQFFFQLLDRVLPLAEQVNDHQP